MKLTAYIGYCEIPPSNGCTAIAFENLKHIRERISNASKFQQWAFRELQRHVEYKAEEYGIDVDDVAPAYTSQRCSHSECGFTTPLGTSGGVSSSTGSSPVLDGPPVNWPSSQGR